VPADWRILPIWSVLKQRKETNSQGEESFILSVIKDKGVVPYGQKGNAGNKAKEDLTGYMIARRGDIVFNSMNVIIGSVGLSPYDGAISPAYYAVYPARNSVCIRYYDYVFQTRQFQYALRLIANGILEIRLKVNYRDFAHLKFPVPAREIQEEIADFLDERCAAIDEAISRQEQLIEKLGEYRKSIIHHAVTGKIDCTEA
jgi:type I restriction enzyme S subunit